MSSLFDLTGREHLSYSSMSSWLECGERFRLERVMSAPQSDAWWFIGGDVTHKVSEQCDLTGIRDRDEASAMWSTAFESAVASITTPLADIKAGGRASKEWPNKENRDWWAANGPGFAANWVTWRNERFNEGWSFLDVDGKPGIEVPFEVTFGDTLVKGYIDRLMVDPHGQVWVVDLKTGSREPSSSLQLGVYALGMESQYGIGAPLGAYWMARSGNLGTTQSLQHYTSALVGNWFVKAKTAIEAEVFIPKVSPLCGSCSVRSFCAAVGGSDAPLRNA